MKITQKLLTKCIINALESWNLTTNHILAKELLGIDVEKNLSNRNYSCALVDTGYQKASIYAKIFATSYYNGY
jgi:hypothetical protein